MTVSGTERCVLDYFILCQEMFTFLSSIKIDEACSSEIFEKEGKVRVTESDHKI